MLDRTTLDLGVSDPVGLDLLGSLGGVCARSREPVARSVIAFFISARFSINLHRSSSRINL